jgi:ABC-type transport system involved in multi-copper enzyme maturation permease subunit
MNATLRKALHDSRRTIMWLAIGLGSYALFIMAYYPSVVKQSAKFDDLLQSYPEGVIAMFYSGDVSEFSISDPGNWLNSEFMLWTLLMLGAMVIAQAFNSITNAERDGTLDLMLSFPVSRRAYLLGRIANTAITILATLTVCFLVFVLSTFLWSEFDVPLDRLALGVYGAFLPLMVVAGFTTLLTVIVPSSQHYAGPLAYLFLMGSYLIHTFSVAIDSLHPLRKVFLFHYYDASAVIRDGLPWGDWMLLAGVALLYMVLAWWLVDKKELGV